MNYDDLRDHSTRDMSETQIIVRCALCGCIEEESQTIGWRTYPLPDGEPLWACASEFANNEAEAYARLESLAAARTSKTPPLSEIEWLSIFVEGSED